MKKILIALALCAVLRVAACAQNRNNSMPDEHNFVKRLNDNYEFVDDPILRKITEDAVSNLNQNSYFGYDFLIPFNGSVKERIQMECNGNWIPNYMSYDYFGDDIKWSFSGYPHDESSYFLTEITFNSKKYNAFGIKPGDDISSSVNKLSSMGFEPNKGYLRNRLNSYNKGDLFIALDNVASRDENEYTKIETITIQVRTFYLGNRIY